MIEALGDNPDARNRIKELAEEILDQIFMDIARDAEDELLDVARDAKDKDQLLDVARNAEDKDQLLDFAMEITSLVTEEVVVKLILLVLWNLLK